jgi:hypothetical protein
MGTKKMNFVQLSQLMVKMNFVQLSQLMVKMNFVQLSQLMVKMNFVQLSQLIGHKTRHISILLPHLPSTSPLKEKTKPSNHIIIKGKGMAI